MTYSEISRRTGLSVSHVSRVMRGIRRPSLNAATWIAWEMGMSVDKFLRLYLRKNRAVKRRKPLHHKR